MCNFRPSVLWLGVYSCIFVGALSQKPAWDGSSSETVRLGSKITMTCRMNTRNVQYIGIEHKCAKERTGKVIAQISPSSSYPKLMDEYKKTGRYQVSKGVSYVQLKINNAMLADCGTYVCLTRTYNKQTFTNTKNLDITDRSSRKQRCYCKDSGRTEPTRYPGIKPTSRPGASSRISLSLKPNPVVRGRTMTITCQTNARITQKIVIKRACNQIETMSTGRDLTRKYNVRGVKLNYSQRSTTHTVVITISTYSSANCGKYWCEMGSYISNRALLYEQFSGRTESCEKTICRSQISWGVATSARPPPRTRCGKNFECKAGFSCVEARRECDRKCDCSDCSDENYCSAKAKPSSASNASAGKTIGLAVGLPMVILSVIVLVIIVVFMKRRGNQAQPPVPPRFTSTPATNHGAGNDIVSSVPLRNTNRSSRPPSNPHASQPRRPLSNPSSNPHASQPPRRPLSSPDGPPTYYDVVNNPGDFRLTGFGSMISGSQPDLVMHTRTPQSTTV